MLVGVNKFIQAEAVADSVFRINDSIRRKQTEQLMRLKDERNNVEVSRVLQNLAAAAKGTENLMPYILTAVESYATLGEIADTLREIFGEY